MSVVPGGSKVKLVETYAEGEDTGHYYGKNRWLAQTFTLDEETVVWRFLLKGWTLCTTDYYYYWAPPETIFYHYDLHETDGAGKPTGAPIAQTTLSPTGVSYYSLGKWRRFDFSGFPVLPAGVYALVTSQPRGVNWKANKLTANSTTSTYTRGKSWISHDSGVTWEEIANNDFMFQVWGYPPPPDPPPEPVISNWAPYQLQYTPIPDGYKIFFTTDNPCHLFMRWTLVPPQQHKIPRLRRGVYLFDDKRFCFVAWHENEQQEAGDTLVHTFIKTAWPVCQTRYFYFVGTRAAEQQPSTSPIFTKHRYEPPPPGPTSDSQQEHATNWAAFQEWGASCQTFTPDHSYIARRISLMLNQWSLLRKGSYIVKLTRINGLPWDEELLWSEVRYSADLPSPGEAQWIHFEDVATLLQEGVPYRIIVHTLPPWYYWNGEEWVRQDTYAMMQGWVKWNSAYDRGQVWYGVDFLRNQLSWVWPFDPMDLTFIVWE